MKIFSKEDLQKDDTLNKYLKESPRLREKCETLAKFLNQWAGNGKATLEVFGSFPLNCNLSDGDVDCVAFCEAERDVFFTEFTNFLKTKADVSDCFAITSAAVPLVSMKLDGTDFDLLYCQVPENFNGNVNSLQPRSIAEKAAVHAIQNTSAILKATSEYAEQFQLATKAVKLWCQQNNLYGSSFGMFPGIAVVLMVASVYSENPRQTACGLIQTFFEKFATFNWKLPVLVGEFKEIEGCWNPLRRPNDLTVVNVVTPVHPQNTTRHISTNSLMVIQAAFKRGLEKLNVQTNWGAFFEKTEVSKNYNFFVEVKGKVSQPEELEPWKGFIKSQFPRLLRVLSDIQELAEIEISSDCECNGLAFQWKIGLNMPSPHVLKELDQVLGQFEEQVLHRADEIGTYGSGNTFEIEQEHFERENLWLIDESSSEEELSLLAHSSKRKNSETDVTAKRQRLEKDELAAFSYATFVENLNISQSEIGFEAHQYCLVLKGTEKVKDFKCEKYHGIALAGSYFFKIKVGENPTRVCSARLGANTSQRCHFTVEPTIRKNLFKIKRAHDECCPAQKHDLSDSRHLPPGINLPF